MVKVGDIVRLPSQRPSHWNKKGAMDKYLGKEVRITYIYPFNNGDGSFQFVSTDSSLSSNYYQFLLSDLNYREEGKFSIGDSVIIETAPYHYFNDKSEGVVTYVSDLYCSVDGNNHFHPDRNKGEIINQIVFNRHLKLKIKDMKQVMKSQVEKVANYLMKRDGNITTLPLKNELRKQFPSTLWNQYGNSTVPGVSDLFHELVREGKFKSIGDNGTYQTYVTAGSSSAKVQQLGKAITKASNTKGLVKGSPTALAAGKKAAATRAANKGTSTPVGTKVSKTKALQLIQGSKGQFITVKFIKKDGTERELNGQYSKDIQPTLGLGLITLREASKAKKTPKDSLRQFSIDRLISVKVKGVTYQVK